jgi:hypothetical protein
LPFELNGTDPLDSVVNVRVTSEEKSRLKDEAGLAGLTVSAFARRRIMGRPVLAKGDEAIIRELRRMGGLAKHIYLETEVRSFNPDDTLNILRSISACIDRIAPDGSQEDKKP